MIYVTLFLAGEKLGDKIIFNGLKNDFAIVQLIGTIVGDKYERKQCNGLRDIYEKV